MDTNTCNMVKPAPSDPFGLALWVLQTADSAATQYPGFSLLFTI